MEKYDFDFEYEDDSVKFVDVPPYPCSKCCPQSEWPFCCGCKKESDWQEQYGKYVKGNRPVGLARFKDGSSGIIYEVKP